MSDAFKDEVTVKLRHLILQKPGVRETESAEAGLTTLSFQSLSRPQRSVWIDTDLKGRLVVDLEDEAFQGRDDHSVAHVVPVDPDACVAVVEEWLGGADLDRCLALAPLKR